MGKKTFFTELATSTATHHPEVKIPQMGLGVWKIQDGEEVEKTILAGLEMGYRLIDTASIYGNEVGVGRAIQRSGIPRQQLFVTSKLWNADIRLGHEAEAFQKTMDRLHLEYLDLYLVHWPISDRIVEPWKALEQIYKTKRVRSIGLSNYKIHHLELLLKNSDIVPVVNQVELHPFLQQVELRKFCDRHGILVQAWSPLMQGHFKGILALERIAQKHFKTIPQVILRWAIQENILVIPKSKNPDRLAENADIFDFKLDLDDMTKIRQLDCNQRFGPDPDHINF
jgi:diketogulonate reductase-like aldo/keto reductase